MFYSEDDMKFDYDHLESHSCFCGKEKKPGELFCDRCREYMPVRDMAELSGMRAGEGMAAAAQRSYTRLERSKRKGWGR